MQLFPKNPNFFLLYQELTAAVVATSLLLTKIDFRKDTKPLAKKARQLETQADSIFHKLQYEIDSTFITPFDREDMHALGNQLNQILDVIENVIADIEVYKVSKNGDGFGKIVKKLHTATQELETIIRLLAQGSRQVKEIKKHIAVVHALENEGDELIRDALSTLFRTKKKDALHLIKWSHIYQNLEVIFDECEETADIVTEIIIKNY